MVPVCYSYVRMSSAIQVVTSLARQQKLFEEYCKTNSLTPDDSIKFQDLGISGFTGDNLSKGALGKFLSLCEQGRIEKHSTLVVEALDRIQRTALGDALQLFLRLLNHVNIHTLIDGKTYTRESINNPIDIMQSILIMHNAWDESHKKSMRLTKAWEQKKARATKTKEVLTDRKPHWIGIEGRKYDGARYSGGKYVLIPERAKIVKKIFELYTSGVSPRAIVKKFNQENIPTWSYGKRVSNGWGESYIKKILLNTAVIGLYQPHIYTAEGKRVPSGEPFKLYPAAISDDLFYLAQGKRNPANNGMKVESVTLWTGLVKCARCGNPMHRIIKSRKDDEIYLVCSAAKRGMECCKYASYRYSTFEKTILTHLSDVINLKQIFGNGKDEETELKNQITSMLQKSKVLNERVDKWIDAIADEDNQTVIKRFKTRIADTEKEIETLNNERARLEVKLRNLSHTVNSDEYLSSFQAMTSQVLQGNEKIKRQLRMQLVELIDRIILDAHDKEKGIIIYFKNGAIVSIHDNFRFIKSFEVKDGKLTFLKPDGSIWESYGRKYIVEEEVED